MLTIYTKPACPACTVAKTLLVRHNILFTERVIGLNATREELLELVPEAKSLPQIFECDRHIGGVKELNAWLGRRGEGADNVLAASRL